MGDQSFTAGNPYNHRDAVTDPDYFVGREEELEEIKYDLSQAYTQRQQFINIGITGKEGAGKSSVGYMIKEFAENRDSIPVRIELNRSLATNEVRLFERLLDDVTNEVGGSIREQFLQKLSGTADEVEFDFRFLRLYQDTTNKQVSESVIRQDLEDLYRKSDSTSIVLILDNAQFLSESEVLLQKVKNVFTEIKGYNLVLIGTEDTFSKIESAFSPVARVFNKFYIGPFDDLEKTQISLLDPLTEDERNRFSDSVIEEIHQLTGGRPYEINLIGYYMYREHDLGEESKITLSSKVIDSVVEQLEDWRRPVNDDITENVSCLSDSELSVLVSAIECSRISKEDLVQYALLDFLDEIGTQDLSEIVEEVNKTLVELVEKGLITLEDGIIEFNGGVYALAYVKYYAFSEGVLEGLGYLNQGGSSDLIANIYYRMTQNILEGAESVGRGVYVSDEMAAEPVSRSVRTKHSFSESERTSIIKGNSALTDQRIIEFSHDKAYRRSKYRNESPSGNRESDDVSITYRLDIDWLDTGLFAALYIASEDVKGVTEKMEKVKDNLGELDYDLILDDEETQLKEGIKHLRSGEVETAIEVFSQAIEIGKAPELWFHRAKAYVKNEDYKEALDDIKVAISKRESWTDARVLQGIIHFIREEEEKGEKSLREAAIYSETEDEICWGEACCMSDDMGGEQLEELSVKFGHEALNQNENDFHVLFHLARANGILGNYGDSIRWSMKIINNIGKSNQDSDDIDGMKASAFNSIGLILEKVGEYELAKEEFEKAIEYHPTSDNPFVVNRAEIEIISEDGSHEELITILEDRIEEYPDSLEYITSSQKIYDELDEKERERIIEIPDK